MELFAALRFTKLAALLPAMRPSTVAVSNPFPDK
jgi:hypothetical protein